MASTMFRSRGDILSWPGIQSVLTLRCIDVSGRWELVTKVSDGVAVPDMVVSIVEDLPANDHTPRPILTATTEPDGVRQYIPQGMAFAWCCVLHTLMS